MNSNPSVSSSQVAAIMVSSVIGIVLIQLISQLSFGSATGSLTELAMIAATWLLLTLAFEFTFGHWVDHKTWSELLANYNVVRGKLWPFVLASIVAAPFIWGRARPSRD